MATEACSDKDFMVDNKQGAGQRRSGSVSRYHQGNAQASDLPSVDPIS